MSFVLRVLSCTVLSCAVISSLKAQKGPVQVWLTDPLHAVFFQQQPDMHFSKDDGARGGPLIAIDEKKTFQYMDGFGWALTGGSAQWIMRMSPAARASLLRELFTSDSNHIGGSYVRISIGASDLNDHVFSYDDLADGKTDTAMEHFDLGPDKKDVVPVLQEILRLNPTLQVLASPWSAPVWMKSNHDTRGGSLLQKYYSAYANYFVHYIEAMQNEGIPITAVTVQNEPLNPGNNPSMEMSAQQEADFIKTSLGPAIERERLATKIIIYDHNADRPDYPLAILRDPDARRYVDGSAFHLYGGDISALSSVHDSFPDKNLYFTEQWVGAPGDFARDIPEHIRKLIIGATRNWCKTVIEWNLASDPKYQPHTDRGGCDRCLGAVTIDGDSVKRNPAYYIIAHAAKFVEPGSSRIESNFLDSLPNVAFRTPHGKAVLIVLNDTGSPQTFTITFRGHSLHPTLNGGAVATYFIGID